MPGRLRDVEPLMEKYMPPGEVAAAMGISLGAVKSATSRGIAALGRMLKGDS